MTASDDFKELLKDVSLETALLHGDAHSRSGGPGVAPDISVTSTFKAIPYDGLPNEATFEFEDPEFHIYSRYTQPVTTRVELVLNQVTDGHALTYRSGLAAAYAAIIHYHPKRIAIREGYHGVHSIFEIYKRVVPELQIIDLDDELREGDLMWLETPLNPSGVARDLKTYSDKAHAAGVKVVVDATFAPPPLQHPFKWGVDLILHSATKYFGGHSDLLAGILVTQSKEEWDKLFLDRTFLGSAPGSLESFLLLRSLRTLTLRVKRQSASATELVQWFQSLASTPEGQEFDGVPGGIVTGVKHSSLQTESWVTEQLEGGHSPTFSIDIAKQEWAKELPFALKFFTAATSLGGVETLIEQRARSDPHADPKLVRISVGLEDPKDLKADLRRVLKQLHAGETKSA